VCKSSSLESKRTQVCYGRNEKEWEFISGMIFGIGMNHDEDLYDFCTVTRTD
ncbi:MAG: hypothetical protein ACI90V_010863, partial [Bacillariaceae sp.]